MKKYYLMVVTALVLLTIASCKKDNDTASTPAPNVSTTSKVHFEVQSVDMDEVGINLGDIYTTPTGDSVSFDFIRYWISNIEFVKEDGSTWKESNSYRLMENTNKKFREEFEVDVPVGKYKAVRFSIGVAPNQNSSLDSIIGELDASTGMNWTWNTGYIFMKNEGSFYNSDSMGYTHYKYHIGTDANYKTITLDLPMLTDFTDGAEFDSHIIYKALNIFSTPHAMDLKSDPALMVGPADLTAKAAANYADAFELHHFMKK